MLIVLFLYLLMASTFTLAKAAVNVISPIFFIALRMMIAGGLLLGYVYFFKRSVWRFSSAHVRSFAAIAFLHIYAAYVLEFWALQIITSSKACLLYNLSPFFTALFVYFLYGERLSKQKWAGLLIGFIGMLPIMWYGTNCGNIPCGLFAFSWADIALLGSVAASAYGWLVMKELIVAHHYSPLMINGIGMLVGGIGALFTSWVVEGFYPTLSLAYSEPVVFYGTIFSPFAATLLLLGFYLFALILIANVIGYNLYGYLLHHYSATFLSFAGFATPLFAGILGWFFLNESITIPFSITFFITVLGLYIFYKGELNGSLLKK